MDYLSRHLAGLPRRLNVAPQLDSIGFIPEKRDIVDRIFPSWNFSFVLAGEGFYELGGVRHKVRAPAVLTQWPGEPMHYGPDSAWREIFLIYPENCGEKLRELGLMRENRPFWQVGNPHRLFELAEEFETLAADAELESNTDRLDCCAVRLVLESLLEKQLGVRGGWSRSSGRWPGRSGGIRPGRTTGTRRRRSSEFPARRSGAFFWPTSICRRGSSC